MSERIFSTPKDVLYGQFSKPQHKAILFTEEQLKQNNLSFNPPFEIKQYSELIKTLLKESNWNLDVSPEGWVIKPLI